MKVILLAASMLGMGIGLGACATASEEEQRAQAEVEKGKICRRMPVMGSNMPQRVCSTAEEWAAFDDATRSSAETFAEERRSGITQGAFENASP